MTQWLTLPLLIHKFGIDPVDQKRNSKHIRHVTTFLQIQKWIKNYTFAYLKNFVTRGHIVQWVFVFLTLAKCKISIHLNKWKRPGESDSIIYYQGIIFHLDSWLKRNNMLHVICKVLSPASSFLDLKILGWAFKCIKSFSILSNQLGENA